MHTPTLIIGQGLCGTWLSYWLQKLGASYMMLDESRPFTSTKVASGVINPVTGRRMVKTWLADELIPFAVHSYKAFGSEHGANWVQECSILDFFSAPDRRLDFEKRATQFAEYLEWPQDEHDWLHSFNYPFGYGIVTPCYQVDVQHMLHTWRGFLQANNKLTEDAYDPAHLQITADKISYKDITADRIIFCDGVAAMQHHYFRLLPFAINKGEALIVDIPDLPTSHIYKKTNTIAPWKNGHFWVGSTYDRNYTHDQPTPEFRVATEAWLKGFLKLPFTVVDHLAALRPTTVERRPFVGMHPQHSNIGIMNGMGTKGVSLAPFFAQQLAENIVHGTAMMADVDVRQYSRILQRG